MPVPRQIGLTADQELATERRDMQGVVYLLSGTLPGRKFGVDNTTFQWATRTFSGALGKFEAYIRPPANIVRGSEYLPGAGNLDPGTRIPVRNLTFMGNVSLLAAIDDGVYAWEHADADLRVGYLKPGQGPEDLAAADWTYLVKGGFFGAPDDLEVDGFSLVLYGKGARRNQEFYQPLTPTSGQVHACDRKDLAVPLPFIMGAPDSWFKLPVRDLGIRGFTVSAHGTGETSVTFRRITEGTYRCDSSGSRIDLNPETVGGSLVSGDCFYIHRQSPLYQIVPSGTVYEVSGELVTVQLNSGLAADVPRGAFVQQHYIARIPKVDYSWFVAGHDALTHHAGTGQNWQDDLRGKVGWLLSDGTIKVADENRWTFESYDNIIIPGLYGVGTILIMRENMYAPSPRWNTPDGTPPCYFDTTEESVGVAQQPQFRATARLSSKMNYPTGGTGVNNANARDGNESTAASLGVGSVITLTFNSAPSPFVNGDTDTSTLHVVIQGSIDFTNAGGGTVFGQPRGTGGVNEAFRFTLGSAEDFNETVRCVGAGGSGGSVVEVWWEHDLSTEEDSSRTQDVVVGASGALGPIMEYAELVMRMPSTKGGYQGRVWDHYDYAVEDTVDQSSEIGNSAGGSDPYEKYRISYPTAVMASMQSYFLGINDPDNIEINADVYAIALEKFKEHDIRLNFVLQRPVQSWSELEQEVALQSRAHMYYGPSGHEIVFMDVLSGVTVSGIVQEFRLPGVPGTNVLRGGRPLLERLGASEIANTAAARYNIDYVEGGEFRDKVEAQNAESVDIFGARRDPRVGGDYALWCHSQYRTHPTFDAQASASGIMQHYADRGAFATTRFNFDTAWVAHGVDRGSPVRVVYEVAEDVYRNVVCEVEEVGVSPLNSERFSVRCRALGLPARGLPAYTWAEVFTELTDKWTDELEAGDAWTARWAIY